VFEFSVKEDIPGATVKKLRCTSKNSGQNEKYRRSFPMIANTQPARSAAAQTPTKPSIQFHPLPISI
jgi:hypothetical protein